MDHPHPEQDCDESEREREKLHNDDDGDAIGGNKTGMNLIFNYEASGNMSHHEEGE